MVMRMRKLKIRTRQKLCKAGMVMICLSYFMAILTVYYEKLFPLFLCILTDTVLTILPSYFQVVEEKEGST